MSDELMVIPDSIEPVVGWRSWQVATHCGEPVLQACTRRVLWMPGAPLEAHCDLGEAGAPQLRFFWTLASTGNTSYASNTANFQLPATTPPAGMQWVLDAEDISHVAPEETCRCGIYAVHDVENCMDGMVFGKIKGWGKVIPAEHGFRCQYAYPVLLLAPKPLVRPLAEQYPGVKVREMPVENLPRKVTAKIPFGTKWAPTQIGNPTPGQYTSATQRHYDAVLHQLHAQQIAARQQMKRKRFFRTIEPGPPF